MLGRRVSAKTAISATASQRFDFSFTGSNDTSTRRADKRVAASESWFAEFALGAHWAHVHGKFHSLLRSHWDHEIPLTRPSATLSPSDGEREGVRGRFMESPLSFFACIGTMNQIGTPLPALSPQGGERVAEGRERGGSWRAPAIPESRIGAMNRGTACREGHASSLSLRTGKLPVPLFGGEDRSR